MTNTPERSCPVVLLHIDTQHTRISLVGTPDAAMTLAIGSEKTGGEYFRHQPPTPAEIERAIMVVEDEVMDARSMVTQGAILLTIDPVIRNIAQIAGALDQPEILLTIDQVEQTFNRLVDLALGRPMTQDSIPTNAEFAATLLILREFMHHLRFTSITISTSNGL